MSGIGFFELLILFVIGLIVLGPEKLPRVATQVGRWIGQARRLTATMQRQLEDELNFDEEVKSIRNDLKSLDDLKKDLIETPRNDDTFSAAHGPAVSPSPAKPATTDEPASTDPVPVEPDSVAGEASGTSTATTEQEALDGDAQDSDERRAG